MLSIDNTDFYLRRFELWKEAKPFPRLTACCDYTLTFSLGKDDFGFSYGNFKRRYSGPKLDLTHCNVKLKIRQLGYAPNLVEMARGEQWRMASDLCEVDGVVSPGTNGEVTFSLTQSDTDARGYCVGQILVIDADGKEFSPGYVRFYFMDNIF